MSGGLRLQVYEEGADAERLNTLTGFLRNELLQLDVEDVSPLRSGDLPPGARAFDVLAVGGLVVSLEHSVEGLRSVLTAIGAWLRRGGGGRKVRVELSGDVLELSDATASEQQRLIEMFISRHAAGEGESWVAAEKP